MSKAERLKKTRVPKRDERYGDRLPPGQVLTERFPILQVGDIPVYDMDEWYFQVKGEVRQEKIFRLEDILQLPQKKIVCDIHCVTRWSKFDNEFEGVLFRDFINEFGVNPEARHVVVEADFDYQTNLPLEDLLGDDVLLAHSYNGKPLTEEHGYPLRLIVPHLYFWKSAKWIRGFQFVQEDKPGFWEQNGFHNYADPFKEQRFSDDDQEMPEDGWLDRDYD